MVATNISKTLLAGLRGDVGPSDVIRELFPWLRSVSPAASSVKYDPKAPALVFSPHLDDAVLGCWWALRRRGSVKVINFFTGSPKRGDLSTWDRVTGGTDPVTHMQQRVSEDREALAVARRRPLNLNFLDSQYRRVAPSIARLGVALGQVAPCASRVYAPVGIGGHADHRLVRRMALDLVDDGVPVCLYAELPYAVRWGWPHWVTATTPDPHRVVDAWWEASLVSARGQRRQLEPHVQTFDVEEAEAKLRALKMYRTQFPAIIAGEGSCLADLDILRYEVYWDVTPCTADSKPSSRARLTSTG